MPWLYGCSFTYLAKVGYHQAKLLYQRTPIEEVLQAPTTPQRTKEKLKLIQEAKSFAENILKLKKSDNYSSFVQLNSSHVTYLLRVSSTHQIESYQWKFPWIGRIPYKGYFLKKEAQAAAKTFPKEKYDTYVRGVAAYSTLGWFDDPILSSMLSYSDHKLVNTIIHETVHTTIFIKEHADFNERLASFIGDIGTEIFYKQKEQKEQKEQKDSLDSPILKIIENENHDRRLFSEFISKEIKELKVWYRQNKNTLTKASKSQRLKAIQIRFHRNLHPKLQGHSYDYFLKWKLNNAKLLSYETYISDLSDFEKLYVKMGKNFLKMIEYLKTLEDTKKPEKSLKSYILK